MAGVDRDRLSRVYAVAEGPIPSAELGVQAVFAALARAGHCELRIGSSKKPRREDVAWADAIVLVRGASPAERRLLLEAKRLGRRVATYMDDDLEHVPAEARSGEFYASALVRENVGFIVRAADDLMVSSGRLGRVLADRHGRAALHVLQPRPPDSPPATANAVAPSGHASPKAVPRSLREPAPRVGSADAPVRIGFLGSVDHAPFLDRLLDAPLRRLRADYGERLSFVFCGAAPAVAAALGAEHHDFILGLSAWRALARSLGVQIGLAPLPDTPFHRCKYWNKFLEYGSLGIAGVYSATPPHADVVVDRETGLLVPNEPEAWLAALRELVLDGKLRSRLAANAAEMVESRFSERALLPGWLASLDRLLSHRAPPISPDDVQIAGGVIRFVRDRFAVYGPVAFAERAVGRLTGRLRPG
jgi:hypothetical protein